MVFRAWNSMMFWTVQFDDDDDADDDDDDDWMSFYIIYIYMSCGCGITVVTTICHHYCYCCGVHEWSRYAWWSVMNVDGWSIKSSSFWDLDGNEHWTSWFMYRFNWIIAVIVMLHPALSCTCNPHMNCSRPFPIIRWCVQSQRAGSLLGSPNLDGLVIQRTWKGSIQSIGLLEILQETPIFNGKNHGFRLRFSLKPIQWSIQLWSPDFELSFATEDLRHFGRSHFCFGL